MDISQQVCTLAQAKRLKELGVNAHCLFGYIEIPANGMGGVMPYWRNDTHALVNTDIILFVANGTKKWYAPTVAELGVAINWDYVSICPPYQGDQWSLCTNDLDFFSHNEAEIRTNVLINLLETEKITPEEVNNRLNQ